jgi:PAS domain S-box-containing protein
MEEALRRSEEHLSSVFSAMAEGVVLYGADARVITCNAAAERILGRTLAEILGTTPSEQHGEAVREDGSPCPVEEHPSMVTLRTGQPCIDAVMGFCKPTGELIWLSINSQPVSQVEGSAPIAVVVTISDITERKRAEVERQQLQQELSHVARVTMMGELTSSLAHELNQPLTAILSNAQTAQRMLAVGKPDPEELGEILSDIVADDERAGGIIGRLRSLLKKGQPDLQVVDINRLVIEVAGLVRSDTIIKNVLLTLDLATDLPPVRGDRVQLQQVVLNLMINAIDAMKGTASIARRLVVRTESGEGLVRVAVIDSGTGIPADKLEHVFEPFYTTKAEGMGMGLAIARSIVRSHGGRLWAENNPAGGATFTLALPTVQ